MSRLLSLLLALALTSALLADDKAAKRSAEIDAEITALESRLAKLRVEKATIAPAAANSMGFDAESLPNTVLWLSGRWKQRKAIMGNELARKKFDTRLSEDLKPLAGKRVRWQGYVLTVRQATKNPQLGEVTLDNPINLLPVMQQILIKPRTDKEYDQQARLKVRLLREENFPLHLEALPFAAAEAETLLPKQSIRFEAVINRALFSNNHIHFTFKDATLRK